MSQRFAPGGSSLGHAKLRLSQELGEVRSRVSRSALLDDLTEFRMRSRSVRRKFEHAWVFQDRDTDANDNAEHLYRWVRSNRADINAYFVLRRDSKDWDRLQSDGFRLIAHGSTDWKLLMLHADHLASSHADAYVTHPLDQKRYGKPRFTYTFLQHGVIHNDLSRWLSWKAIDVFVTTTPAEYEAIAGPGPYSFSSHEVVLTGLPRHDALLDKRQSTVERDLILIMPTWRQTLLGEQVPGTNARAKIKNFGQSRFALSYSSLLANESLRELAQRQGKTLAFMPHPNMRPYLDDFEMPSDVQILDFRTDNVQDVLARTSAFITDYSSLAFDAAFLDIPLVYFQFDAEEFFDGSHVGRRGYFDFATDGFGPVREDASAVVDEILAIAERDWTSSAEVLARTKNTFVTRDADSCSRVIAAMEATGRPTAAR